MGHFVGTVNFHDVAASEVIARLARVGQVEAVLALGNDLGENVHAIVGAIEDKLAKPPLGRIFNPWPGELEGQQVAHHALVGVRGQQRPVIVLAHAQDCDLLFHAALFQRLVQRTEGIGFLVAASKRGVAAVAQGNIAIIVDVLARVPHRVGPIKLALTVVDNLHPGCDALIALDILAVHVKPHDGQVGGGQPDILVVRRIIDSSPCVCNTRQGKHCQHQYNQSFHLSFGVLWQKNTILRRHGQ